MSFLPWGPYIIAGLYLAISWVLAAATARDGSEVIFCLTWPVSIPLAIVLMIVDP